MHTKLHSFSFSFKREKEVYFTVIKINCPQIFIKFHAQQVETASNHFGKFNNSS